MWQRVASGRRIGPYELREEIGRGGSAVVFRALHADLGHAVAIKIIAAGFASDATFQARFRQEADLISRLDHPNILRVLDSGETSGEDPLLFSAFAYLVTEYMPGGSLAQEIKRERSRRQRCVLALTVAKHIGAALDYAHGSGVLHRDIKPSNVFVDGDGRFVLGDFGLARVLQSSDASLHLTATGLVAGTPAYMAPEQALGEPADSRTDLYGLAVVLYQIITGRVPFEAETPLATMLAHVHQPPPSPREVAPETPLAVEAVLLRALAKARDERYGSGNELTRALRAAVLAAYGPASVDDAVEPDAYHSTPATASAALLHFPSSKAGMAARPPRSRRRLPKAARLLLVGVGALATFSSVGAGAAAYVLGPGRAPVAAFAERFALSSTEPTWTDAWPKQGAVNQSLQTSISIRFSHDMDRESVESAITLSPDVPVSFSWDRRALTLTPLEEMREGTEYVLFLDHTRTYGADGRLLSRPLLRRFSTLTLPQPPALPPPSTGPAPAPAANNSGGPASLIPIFPVQPTPERTSGDIRNVTRPPQAPSPTSQPLPSFSAPTYAPPTAPAQPPDTSMVAGLVVTADDDGLQAAMQMTPQSTTTPAPSAGTVPTATPVAGTPPVSTASPTYPQGISLVNVPPPAATPAPVSATATPLGGGAMAGPSSTSGPAGQLDSTAPTATATRSRTASQTPIVSATAAVAPTKSPTTVGTGAAASVQLSPTSTTTARIIASATATGTPENA